MAVIDFNLAEAAKLNSGNVLSDMITQIYHGSNDILGVLPYMDITGNSFRYNREGALPGAGFRGVNEAYTQSTGQLDPHTESLVIAGGDIQIDKFILGTMGQDQMAVQAAMKTRALGLMWANKFINGNTANDVREFDGLEVRCTGNQVISAGTTAGGAALSLAKMDEVIDQCLNPTHIIMNKAMARRFAAAARLYTVGGYVTFDGVNAMGQRVMQYNGLPILVVDLDGQGNAILGFDEAANSGSATATSIYVVSMRPDGLMGLQNGGMQVSDLGELQTAPKRVIRMEWWNGLAHFNNRAIARLKFIGDLAIVA